MNTSTDTSPDLLTLEGPVERVLFRGDDGAFAIVRIRAAGGERHTVVGALGGIDVGEVVTATGAWETNPRFGRQFRARHATVGLPATDRGLVDVLASLVDGIGDTLATRLVNALGGADGALRWLSAPAASIDIPGVPARLVADLRAAWAERSAARGLEVALASLGITPSLRAKIGARYGKDALVVVRSRPYDLALEIDGVGFRTADGIAKALGVGAHSTARATAALRHALLDEASGHGHIWCEREIAKHLIDKLCESPMPDDVFAAAIDALIRRGMIVVGESGGIALSNLRNAELSIADHVVQRLGPAPLTPDPAGLIARNEEDKRSEAPSGFQLGDEQRRAAIAALTERVLVITGGPGVGKTTVTRAIADLWTSLGVRFLLCAPTGRAARRLSEASGYEAATIHRTLGIDPQTGGFLHGKHCRLDTQIILVDESSMADVSLLAALFDALPNNARIVLVGDADQLPPVGPGAPFRDLCAGLPAANVHRLAEVYRQARGSRIVMGAREILAGKPPTPSASGSRDDGALFVVEEPNDLELAKEIVDLVADAIPTTFGIPSKEIQVVSPQRKGAVGVEALNLALRDRLNPRPAHEVLTVGREEKRTFRLGDRVMQTKNDYEKGVVNGELGVVTKMSQTRLVITFEDGSGEKAIEYQAKELGVVELAFASTCHKIQGSEFPAVIVVCHDSHHYMLERALVYTAVTRGKRLCVIAGTRKALARACKNARADARRTTLPAALETAFDTTAAATTPPPPDDPSTGSESARADRIPFASHG